MKILAFDPGGTTGIACGRLELEAGHMEVDSFAKEWDHSEIYSFCVVESPDILIWERFDYRNRSRAGLDLISREYIGVLALYSQQYNRKVYTQNPSEGLAYYSDNRLKTDGVLHESVHANDAMRHLLYWYNFGPGYKYNKEGFTKFAFLA